MLDITLDNDNPILNEVEVQIRHDGNVLWVNVGPKCVLRICRIKDLKVIDERPKRRPMMASGQQGEAD